VNGLADCAEDDQRKRCRDDACSCLLVHGCNEPLESRLERVVTSDEEPRLFFDSMEQESLIGKSSSGSA